MGMLIADEQRQRGISSLGEGEEAGQEAAEGDEEVTAFWGMFTARDEDGEDQFSLSSGSESSEVESDFDLAEEEEPVEEELADDGAPAKKKGAAPAYVDPKKRGRPPLPRPKDPAPFSSKSSSSSPPSSSAFGLTSSPKTPSNSEPRGLRRSTQERAETSKRNRLHEEQQALLRRRSRPLKEVSVYTHEELLEMAKETEVQNVASLQGIELREEEEKAKRRALFKRGSQQGPMVRYYSGPLGTFLCFTHADSLPPCLCSPPLPEPPSKRLCPVSGLQARYRDPVTGLQFATVQAYQQLKQRFHGCPPEELRELPGNIYLSQPLPSSIRQ